MQLTRRDFLKTAGWTCSVAALPSWVVEVEAAEAAAVDKHALADIALKAAKQAGATYADIRINRYRNESIFSREQRIQRISRSQNFGFGVRVLLNGAWGFASSYQVTPEAVRRITGQALDIARSNAVFQRKPIHLVSTPKVAATWTSSFVKDPFDLSADRK